ncbi:MAG: ceramidase domain-containing protein [Deltaproteobacteria bacterium]
MAWTDKILAYCERAGDPAFWAEPFNAVSNDAFFLAAIAAAVELARRADAGARRIEWALVVLVGIIGTGSFLFHTYATRWASVADTAPIGIFMIGYLGYAMRRFLEAPVLAVILALGLFLAAMRYAGAIPCDPAMLPITAAAGRPCFNGSLGYVPALAALVMIGGALLVRRHPAGGLVLASALVFAISLTFRTIDFEVCDLTPVFGRSRGTHAVWHMLNAALLYMLLIAAIRHGRSHEPASI